MHVAGPNHIAAQAHRPGQHASHAAPAKKPKEDFEALHFQKVASEPAVHKADAKPDIRHETKPETGAAAADQSGTAAAHSKPPAKRLGSLIDIRA